MKFSHLTLTTRGSALALVQADAVEAALRGVYPEIEMDRLVLTSTGDKRMDLKLSEFSSGPHPVLDKGIFTKELEMALEAGHADVAVHSLKDVPTILEPSFQISAVLPRAAIEDVVIFRDKSIRNLADLAPGAIVATSSVRRARFLSWRFPALNTADIRGNVQTRLRKTLLGQNGIEATMLAKAGLERLFGSGCLDGGVLRFEGEILPVEVVDPDWFLPAAGQGAIALEHLSARPELAELLAPINDLATWRRITAERAFLAALGAGCQTPVGTLTEIPDALADGPLSMKAAVFSDDGGPPVMVNGRCQSGEEEELGRSLAREVI